MANFETLNILFKADASQLKKEVDDVKKKTGEATDTFKKTEEQTKKTDNEFANLAKSLAKIATAYFTVGSVIGGFQSAMANTRGIFQLSQETGIGTEKLDAYSKAVKNAGGNVQAFQSDLINLSKSMNLSGEDALTLLTENVARDLKRIKNEHGVIGAQRFGQQAPLNLSPDTISLLLQNIDLKSLAARQQEIGTVNKKDVEIAAKLNKSTGELGDSFDELFRVLARDVAPNLADAADSLATIVRWISGQAAVGGIDELLQFGTPAEREAAAAEKRKADEIEKGIWDKIFGRESPSINGSYYVPPTITPISNSQAQNISVGNVTVNSTAQDGKKLAEEFRSQLDNRMFWNSNSYFDNGQVI